MKLDDATLERIIEQITHEVMVLVEEGRLDVGGEESGLETQLSRRNYVDRVQPVVKAGADRVASTLGIVPADRVF